MKMQISSRWFKTNKKPALVEAMAYACHYHNSGTVSISIWQPATAPRGPQSSMQINMTPADAVKLANQILANAAQASEDQVLTARIAHTDAIYKAELARHSFSFTDEGGTLVNAHKLSGGAR